MNFQITSSMKADMEYRLKPRSIKKKRPKKTAPTPAQQQRILQARLNKLADEYWRLRNKDEEQQQFNRAKDRPHYSNIQEEQEMIYREMKSITEQIKHLSS